jgi:hypothetical protein
MNRGMAVKFNCINSYDFLNNDIHNIPIYIFNGNINCIDNEIKKILVR